MERITIAMQDGGAGAGARAASQPHFVLPPNLYMGPPGGGLFGFKFSSRPHPRKFGVKRFLVVRQVAGAVSGVALFWATSLEKIYRQPRGRVNGQSRHGRIWQFMRQNMNSPTSTDYRTLSLPPRKPVGPWGQVLNCSEIQHRLARSLWSALSDFGYITNRL